MLSAGVAVAVMTIRGRYAEVSAGDRESLPVVVRSGYQLLVTPPFQLPHPLVTASSRRSQSIEIQ
ncbi:hypothetical protein WME75_33165 [Sorangium sp. So ce1014]|uniref:hypothetical protein n=1 Tax=Sorangium sp. So ce1014 TaxID=3133326 RepID=UPI003F5EA4E3